MKHIVVWMEQGDTFVLNDAHRATLALATRAGGMVTAVFATAQRRHIPEAARCELARHGAQRLVCLDISPEHTGPEATAAALHWALTQPPLIAQPVTDVVATAHAAGRDCMARLSARLDAPLLQDCVAVDFAVATGKKYLLQGRICGEYALPGPINCWSIRPGAYTAQPPACETTCQAAHPVDICALSPPAARPRVRPSDRARANLATGTDDPLETLWAEQPDIMEAATIISGGRALGSAAAFRLLHDAAAPLHAAVGASRSAVDMGYAPPFVQVGQTGVVVSPALYIACGISGSIFHTTGIKGARTVVAVNSDPGAQIFHRADYGLTDDLFAVLPILRRLLEEE